MTKDLRHKLEKISLNATGVRIDEHAGAHLPRNIALLVIDVQNRFCKAWPTDNDTANDNIDSTVDKICALTPAFRKAGIPVYAIHFTGPCEAGARDPNEIDFYKFKPDVSDILVRKEYTSSFNETNLDELLKKRGIKSVLACGFYTSACVSDTVFAALKKGYNVALLEDMTSDGFIAPTSDKLFDTMRAQGIEIITSSQALQRLKP